MNRDDALTIGINRVESAVAGVHQVHLFDCDADDVEEPQLVTTITLRHPAGDDADMRLADLLDELVGHIRSRAK